MKPNELRIGNLVRYANDGSNCIVTLVGELGLSVEVVKTKEITWIEFEEFEPILLTPEILEKAGFAYNDLDGDSGFWQIKHPNAAGLIQILEGEEGFTYSFQSTIKHLHQLQNLYFALTGEELDITL